MNIYISLENILNNISPKFAPNAIPNPTANSK